MYEAIVSATVDEFGKQVRMKMRDANTFKVTLNDRPKKSYLSYPNHKLVFVKALGTKLKIDEGLFPCHSITSLERLNDVFDSRSLLKSNSFNDLALATPIFYLDVLDDRFDRIHRGDFCIPISKTEEMVKVFFRVVSSVWNKSS